MTILILSPYPEKIAPALDAENLGASTDKITEAVPGAEWVICYGYRHILPPVFLKDYPDRCINIHIGFLPWNRGADPNFWSWFDDTPKGVTIHHMDEGIDTGDIIAQQQMIFSNAGCETLASTYELLHKGAVRLFARMWPIIKHGGGERISQKRMVNAGSYHKKADFEPWKDKLPSGWETPVSWVAEQGRKARGEKDGHRGTGT